MTELIQIICDDITDTIVVNATEFKPEYQIVYVENPNDKQLIFENTLLKYELGYMISLYEKQKVLMQNVYEHYEGTHKLNRKNYKELINNIKLRCK
jgi:predicted small metal-binding protein